MTEEFSGITAGGGIGTCFGGLSRLLARIGYRVDVLITSALAQSPELSTARASLYADGINLILLQEFEDPQIAATVPVVGADAIVKSYRCYRFLERQEYDIVHFHDYLGLGFYSAMARRQGLVGFALITQIHGSSEWVRRHNFTLPDLGNLETEALERSQIELSDLVVSPSSYLLDWYRANGVALPEHAIQLNWTLPGWSAVDAAHMSLQTRALQPGSLREIIFFGRHERRKGVEIFTNAVRHLRFDQPPLITFLGRFDLIDRENTVGYIFRRLQDYPGRLRFLNKYDQDRALRYIRSRPAALCVLPSLVENSPCVVGEAFSLGIPFIASSVGGTAELIDPADRDAALFPADSGALADRMQQVYQAGLPRISSTLLPARIATAWQEVHEQLGAENSRPSPVAGRRRTAAHDPLVSVCLVHYERPRLLTRTLNHLFEQSYRNMEIIIVDDGSRSPAAKAALDRLEESHRSDRLSIIRSANRYLGAARNLAASAARGDYLLFHDDDNLAEPDEIRLFVRAAQNGHFEILTSQCYVFKEGSHPDTGRIEYFPIGIGGDHSFFSNRFGDANALVARSAFEKVGGFSELRDVGWEDWEFFLRAFLQGIRIGVVPRPLFRYQSSPIGMLAGGSPVRNNARIFDAVREIRPALSADVLQMARRDAVSQQVLDRTWDMLGREPFGFLHRELMALEPNSEAAMTKIVDLAFYLGRHDDALELGLGTPSIRDQLHRLLTASGTLGLREARLVPERCTVLPNNEQAFEIEGWLATDSLGPLRIRGVMFGRRRFWIEDYTALPRGDVAASTGQRGAPPVGFRLTIVEDSAAAALTGEETTEIALDRVGYDFPEREVPIVVAVDGRHDVRIVKGCIERFTPVCRRLLRLPAAAGSGFTGRLGFLLEPQPEDGRVVCGSETSPLIDVGEQRFEAFSPGISSFAGTPEPSELPVLALYSRNDLSVMEAVAYRWN